MLQGQGGEQELTQTSLTSQNDNQSNELSDLEEEEKENLLQSNLLSQTETIQQYRELIAQLEATQTNNELESNGNLTEKKMSIVQQTISQSNHLIEQAQNPFEARWDSKLLLKVSQVAKQLATQMHNGPELLDPVEVIQRIKQYKFKYKYKFSEEHEEAIQINNNNQVIEKEQEFNELNVNNQNEDTLNNNNNSNAFDELSKFAHNYWKLTPNMDFLLGPLSLSNQANDTNKIRRIRKVGNGLNSKEVLKSTQISSTELEKERDSQIQNTTTYAVKQIFDLLKACGAINLFQFALNPDSFAESVENLFHIAFLIRENRARTFYSKEGILMLEAINELEMELDGNLNKLKESEKNSNFKLNSKRYQAFVELDANSWLKLLDVFNIKEAKIPSRKKLTQDEIEKDWNSSLNGSKKRNRHS